jgi:hypothetical protein
VSNSLNVFIAEVYAYNDSYKSPERHFAINVLVREDSNTKIIEKVIPLNNNIKQLPIVGENVLIVEGYSETSKTKGAPQEADGKEIQREKQWFYLPAPVNIRFGLKENISYSNSSDELYPAPVDPEFKNAGSVKVAGLQPFKGDLLIESRWGSTIRLGSSCKKDLKIYNLEPTWTGEVATDPLMIISNGQLDSKLEPNVQFKLENIETDISSIYLTTTQKLTKFKLGGKTKKNPLKKFKAESEFNKSQFIATADRIVLQAKSDIAVLDSPKAIVLNTTGYIKLGNDKADQPLPHGHVLYKILQKILNQLSTPIQCGTMMGSFMTTAAIKEAQAEMKNLLNKNFFITKNTY